MTERGERRTQYLQGALYGRRLAEHDPDREDELWLDLRLGGATHRAYDLGALRAYRQATGRPEPLYGHKVTA